jgi:formylmethanofuran dehydrogenase subunit E
MSEENKDVKGKEAPVEKPAEAPLPAQPAPAAVTSEKKAEEKKPQAKKERPANCAACNKSIKKKRWYYRNGKYFCTKRCWQTTKKKEDRPKEGEAAAAK